MNLLDALVEQRIAAAEARGELRDLPGSGQPQNLDEDPLIPAEVRLAHRILKNAGFVPPAVAHLKEAHLLRQEWRAAEHAGDEPAQRRLQARLLALDLTLETLRGQTLNIPPTYRQKVAEHLTRQGVTLENDPVNPANRST